MDMSDDTTEEHQWLPDEALERIIEVKGWEEDNSHLAHLARLSTVRRGLQWP